MGEGKKIKKWEDKDDLMEKKKDKLSFSHRSRSYKHLARSRSL